MNGDPSQGSIVTIENMQQMPMPVIIEFTTESGSKSRHKLPVEIWKRNKKWTFKHDSDEPLKRVKIDPDFVLPDVNSSNNTWTPELGAANAENLSAYVGEYSSSMIPVIIKMVVENNELVAVVDGQPNLYLTNDGDGKFLFEEADLEIQFNEEKSSFEMSVSGQIFEFKRK